MKVFISNKQTDVSLCSHRIKALVVFILGLLKVRTNEISVHFVSKSKICKLHKDFFNDSSFTDTITLPIDHPYQKEEYHVLGECFICPKAALDFCSRNKNQDDEFFLYKEITLYLIHSILHLVGFEDTNHKDKKKMQAKEKFVLNKVISKNFLLCPKNLSKKAINKE